MLANKNYILPNENLTLPNDLWFVGCRSLSLTWSGCSALISVIRNVTTGGWYISPKWHTTRTQPWTFSYTPSAYLTLDALSRLSCSSVIPVRFGSAYARSLSRSQRAAARLRNVRALYMITIVTIAINLEDIITIMNVLIRIVCLRTKTLTTALKTINALLIITITIINWKVRRTDTIANNNNIILTNQRTPWNVKWWWTNKCLDYPITVTVLSALQSMRHGVHPLITVMQVRTRVVIQYWMHPVVLLMMT